MKVSQKGCRKMSTCPITHKNHYKGNEWANTMQQCQKELCGHADSSNCQAVNAARFTLSSLLQASRSSLCTSTSAAVILLRSADDTAVLGLISDDDVQKGHNTLHQ